MSSKKPSEKLFEKPSEPREPLDFEVPTTPEDLAVLRRLREMRPEMSFAAYLEWLSDQDFSRFPRRTKVRWPDEPFEL